MCITDKFHLVYSMPKIPVGEVCTVIDTKEYDGYSFYKLSEYQAPEPRKWWYDVRQFIPLSDICETELAKQREELQTV